MRVWDLTGKARKRECRGVQCWTRKSRCRVDFVLVRIGAVEGGWTGRRGGMWWEGRMNERGGASGDAVKLQIEARGLDEVPGRGATATTASCETRWSRSR